MNDLDDPVDLEWLLSHQDLMLVTRDGLGDHIVAAGLACWLAQQVRRVYVPGRRIYWPSVEWMFKTVPNIFPVGLEPGSNWNTLEQLSKKLGCQLCKSNLEYPLRSGEAWFRACYSQYHLDYQTRFESSPKVEPGPRAQHLYAQLITNSNYIVVHNNSTERDSYSIDILQGRPAASLDHMQVVNINNQLSSNIFDWVLILQNAKEIHLVESSVYHLCQLISPTLLGDVYFHHIRAYSPHVWERDLQPYHPNWKWIEYPFRQ